MIEMLKVIVESAWNLLTTVKIPTTEIPFSMLFIGGMIINASIRLINLMFGIGGDGTTGNSRRIKISESRRSDTK